MTIDPANLGLRILPADLPQAPLATPQAAKPGSFGEQLQDAVGEVDSLNLDARYKLSSLLEGGGGDVHDAMIAVENVAATNLTNAEAARNATVQATASMSNVSLMDYLSNSGAL